MRKQDLKVGVEYAVHLNPTKARSRYGRDKPLKATVVEVDGTVERKLTVVGYSGSYGPWTDYRGEREPGQTIPHERVLKEHGVVVELAEPVQKGTLSPSGQYVENRYSGFRPVEEYEQDDFEAEARMVTRVALKNGGCFVSTWADYEADQKDAARYEQERVEKEARDLAFAQAQEPIVEAKLESVLDAFRAAGYTVTEQYPYAWRDEDPAETYRIEEYHCVRPGEEADNFGYVEVVPQYRGGHTHVEHSLADRYPMVDIAIKKLRADDLLRLVGEPVPA